MTIATAVRAAGPYTGTGAVSVYPFGFKVFQASDLLVQATNTAGSISTLVLSSDYTVTLNADQNSSPGGTVNLLAALPLGYKLGLTSNVSATQPVALTNGGGFFPKVIEGALDRLTILLQQTGLLGVVQALRVPEIGGIPPLPPAAARANRIQAYDSAGNPLMIVGVDSGSAASLALDLANTALPTKNSALVGHIAAGAGAVATTTQAKLRERVSLADFGAVPNDSSKAAQNTAAWLAAVASFPEQSTAFLDGSAYSNAGRIDIGPGTWWFSAGWVIQRNLHIRGASSPDGNSFGATRLVFPDNVHGITIHNYLTGPDGTGGDGSMIENVAILPAAFQASGATPAPGSYHGVWLRARAKLLNCAAWGWSGNGVQVIATAGVGGLLEGNANSWSVTDLVVAQNGGHGLFVSGSDANAGKAERVDSRANRKCGIRDSSFLGNTYLACHTANNGKNALVTYGGHNWYCLSDTLGAATTPGTNAAVWVDMGAGSGYTAWSGAGSYFIGSAYCSGNANARNSFVGCYSEGGQAPSDITGEETAPGASSPSLVVGGIHAASFTTRTSAPYLDSGQGYFVMRNAVTASVMGFDLSLTTPTAVSTVLDRYKEGTFTPTVTGLTVVGTPTYTGNYTVIGDICFFSIEVAVSGGTTAATAGTTTFTLPPGYVPVARDTVTVVDSAVVSLGVGLLDTASSGLAKPPTWSARAATVVISGQYRIAST